MKEGNIDKIGIIGAGGWGTAMSLVLAENGHNIRLWSYVPEITEEINTKRTNSIFLSGAQIPKNITATSDSSEFGECDLLVMATPTQFIRGVLENFETDLSGKYIVNLAKGIERKTLLRVSELMKEAAGVDTDHYCVLSGPSHAEEVAKQMPTTVVTASDNIEFARTVQKIVSTNYFRIYTSSDVTGCEIGGSLKNVIALAAGVIDGLGLGDNTKAALITRGLVEMTRLGTALGAKARTFSGLSGLGDLFVTANSRHSRNRYVGEQIGRGKTLEAVARVMQMVAEGVHTTESVYHLGQKAGVELPITEQTYAILFGNIDPIDAVQQLMNREHKKEWW
jgi:glycerol-3-phosphate dehydrogenase (NAD(P)+)